MRVILGRKHCSFLLVLLLGLILGANVLAQEPSEESADINKEKNATEVLPQAIPVDQIASFLATLRAKKNKFEAIVMDTKLEQEIVARHDELENKLNEFASEHERLINENTPSDVWSTRSGILEGYLRENVELVRALQNRAIELAQLERDLAFSKAEWTLTATETSETKMSASLMTDIQGVLKQISAYELKLSQQQGVLLKLQRQLETQSEQIESLMKKQRAAVSKDRDRLLKRNAAVLWEAINVKNLTDDWHTWCASVSKQCNELKVFWDKNRITLALYLLIFVVIVIMMRGIHRVIRPKCKWSRTLQRVEQLAEVPVPIAALLAAIIFIRSDGTALHITKTVAGLIAVIPALAVMRQIFSSYLTPVMSFLMLVFGIDLFNQISFEATLISRLFVLTEAIAVIAFILFYLRQASFEEAMVAKEEVRRRFRWAHIIGSLVLLLMAVSVLANVMGYVEIASRIVYTVLMTLVDAVINVAAAHFVLALVLFVLTVPPVALLRVVNSRASKVAILTRTKILLYFLVWLAVFNDIFNLAGFPGALHRFFFRIFRIHITCGSVDFLLGELVLALFILVLARPISRALMALLTVDILPRLKWDNNPQKANSCHIVQFFAQYLPYFVCILVACAVLGLSLSNIAMVASALTLGISFGLQDIFKNFVSGIILMFEPRISLNGTVEFGTKSGSLVNVGMRASEVRLLDGRNVIVPNSELISKQLVSIADTHNVPYRFGIPFALIGEPDVDEVRKVAEERASLEDGIVDDPKPMLMLSNIDNGYPEFTLYAWAENYNRLLLVKSNLTYNLFKALKAKGWHLAGVKNEIVNGESASDVSIAAKVEPLGKEGS